MVQLLHLLTVSQIVAPHAWPTWKYLVAQRRGTFWCWEQVDLRVFRHGLSVEITISWFVHITLARRSQTNVELASMVKTQLTASTKTNFASSTKTRFATSKATNLNTRVYIKLGTCIALLHHSMRSLLLYDATLILLYSLDFWLHTHFLLFMVAIHVDEILQFHESAANADQYEFILLNFNKNALSTKFVNTITHSYKWYRKRRRVVVQVLSQLYIRRVVLLRLVMFR